MSQEQHANTLMHQLKKHFELVAEPFSAQAAFFFEGAQRIHNLETLKHLATFGDLVLFLTGEKGAGKTHLLRQFEVDAVNELRTVFIDCNLALQSGNGRQVMIVQSCLEAMQLPLKDEGIEESCLRLLKACESQLALDGRRTLFIFDCADKLPRQQVLALCGFCRNLPDESPLVMLFSGSHALLQNSKLGTNLEQNAWWHQIQLKPLSSNEILAYLNQALAAAGYTGELELNEQQLAQLVQVGKGLPGRINKIFPSVLLEPGLLKLPSLRTKRTISLGVMAGLVGLLVLSFLIVAFQHGVFERLMPVFSLESSEESIPEAIPQKVVSDTESENQQAARLAMLNAELEKQALTLQEKQEDSVSVDASLQQTQAMDSAERSASDEATDLSKVIDVEPSEGVVQPVVEVEQAVSKHSALEQPREEESKSADVVVELSKPKQQPVMAESSKRNAAFRDKSWLQTQPKNAYIPQILGSFEEQTAIKFIRQLGDQKYDIYYLETEHKARPWFVVFYGVFATKTEAQAAIKSAPERIKRQNPWLRSVDSVLGSYPAGNE